MSTLTDSSRSEMAQPAPKPHAPALARIDGQSVNVANLDHAVRLCMRALRSGHGFTLFTLNLDHLVRLRDSAAFRAVYSQATFVTADGSPIVRMARRADPTVERATGADLVAPLCAAAAWERIPVYLFGANDETLEKAAVALTTTNPGLVIAGAEAPPYGFDPASADADAAADRVARSGARLCFVALGAPKQEFFSARMARRHPHIGWLGIGAALDFLAGEKMRAPRWVQMLQLEWFWRLAQEPRRLGVRYARCMALLLELSLRAPSSRAARPGL